MPAPALSHVILTGALIGVIFMVQVFYFYVVDNVWVEMTQRELQELTDYVADTIANLYFLVNATNTNPMLTKTLRLPLDVGGASYTLQITYDQSNNAQSVESALEVKSWVTSASWLPRGLKVDTAKTQAIEGSGRTVVAGCQRVASNIRVWIAYEG